MPYTITIENLYWQPRGIITDASSGISYAVDGKRKVALNVPLAECCDEPVELCACLAPVVRVANNRVAA